MAQYEKVFTKPYEDGYENLPSQNTPITAQTLNDKDTAIEHIEDFLDGNEFPTAEDESAWDGAVSDIEWNQSNNFLLKNLFTGFTANTSISGGSETTNTGACISNKASVESFSQYVVTDSKSADRFAHCYNGDTYLGFAAITKDVPFVPNSLKNGCNAIIIQWNKTNEGYILPTDGKMYKNIPSNSELAQITSIGTDESGKTTASKAYAIGEHFYKDGKFCTAKTAIASGATFTLNTNYVEGNVANSIDNGFFDLSQKYDASSLIGTISTGQNSVTITPPISGLLSLGLRTSGSDSWVIAYDQTDSPSSNIIGGSASTKNATALVTTIPVNANRNVIIKYYGMSDLLCANIIPLKFK